MMREISSLRADGISTLHFLNLLIMYATSFESTGVVNRTIVTDVDHVLNGGTPILHKYLWAMGAIESGQSVFASHGKFEWYSPKLA